MYKTIKHSNNQSFVFPDCHEITGNELFKINGGGTREAAENNNQSETSSSSTPASYTVQSGDTLSQIVHDYNQANGTNLTVNEVAQLSGIENPDLIHPGQSIVFVNPSQTNNSEALPAQSSINNTNGYVNSVSNTSNIPDIVTNKENGIILNDTSEDQEKIIHLINKLSFSQYENKNGKLSLIKGRINVNGSKIYSNAINNIMKNGYVEIKIDNLFTKINANNEKVEERIYDSYGNVMPGSTFGSIQRKEAYVTVTGDKGFVYPTAEGYESISSPERILMHELAGHTEPMIMNRSGNAISIENKIMEEIYYINPFRNSYLKRMEDSTHLCFH